MARVTATQLPQVRGAMLGLMLGDAIGATGGKVPDDGLLPSTCAGQLACYTVEGLIRAWIRADLKGICHPPSVVWHAYHRWAAGQMILGIKRWGSPDEAWPDGWLADVPALAQRRGSAPATVSALQQQVAGTLQEPVGASLGAHALTRSLPAGIGEWGTYPGSLAAEIAALTHRGEAVSAAAVGATIIGFATDGRSVSHSVEDARKLWASRHLEAELTAEDKLAAAAMGPATAALEAASTAARSSPGRRSVLGRLAPDRRAVSALAGGLYVALSATVGRSSPPGPDDLRTALLLAARAGNGAHAAAVAGAVLGAAHGVDALPVDWLSRLELAWVADSLAHDTVRQFTEHPAGADLLFLAEVMKQPDTDPNWRRRYPGW
ncbi:ADP-ribosylglycohydrolase family protein [Micromonospora coxensis]|uniref:ADP-ribosylglycohydrolase n=1 Tax=Micromonospora coxensis TaxID=356852 RepID=A0A1C5GYB5_9ACTN|nr:ADP-ribosylglycohydrolase family protein [Micromonospora coxensis]SCG38782.1 ADP-ribosylglycohydrolase [Micromonospora coxensis]